MKSPSNQCPTCDGMKAKNSFTCIRCFKLGKRKRNPHNNGEPTLKRSAELREAFRKRVKELKEESHVTW